MNISTETLITVVGCGIFISVLGIVIPLFKRKTWKHAYLVSGSFLVILIFIIVCICVLLGNIGQTI